MIRKLLLVRVNDVTSDLLTTTGLSQFVKDDPLPVSPLAWHIEAGMSHWGYVLDGMKLADWKELQKWIAWHPDATLLEIGAEDKPLAADDAKTALAAVGLRINDAA